MGPSHISQPTCPRPWPLLTLLLSPQRCSPGPTPRVRLLTLLTVSYFPKYRADLRQGHCFVHQGAEALASPETGCGALGNTVQKCGELLCATGQAGTSETEINRLPFLFSMCLGPILPLRRGPMWTTTSCICPWSYEHFRIGNTHLCFLFLLPWFTPVSPSFPASTAV